MLGSTLRFLAVAVSLFSMSAISLAAEIDNRLVGDWQGQRDPGGKCQFLAWKMSRFSSGRFEIVFYEDVARTRVANRESGTWWVKASEFYTQTKGVPTPDG